MAAITTLKKVTNIRKAMKADTCIEPEVIRF